MAENRTADESMWHRSNRPSSLPAEDAVHLWWIDVSEESAGRVATQLTAEDEAHAARMRAAPTRTSWITARGCLRLLAGSYLGVDPLALSFSAGPYGKPALAGPFGALAFSVSHTDSHVVLAFARDVAVGVDIEEVRALPELDALIESQCTPDEQTLLRQVDREERTRGFIGLWTQKEAIAKAIGLGVHLDFRSISLDPKTGAARLPTPLSMQVHGVSFSRGAVSMGAFATVSRALEPDFRILALNPELGA